VDSLKFQEILDRITKPVGIYEDRFYTEEDVKNMTNSQLCEISLEMMERYTGPGSYWLRTELFILIDYLDEIISFPEDPNLEKNLHLTASLVCLAWMQNFDFSSMPRRAAKHLERVIGKHLIQTPSMEFDPSLQIATFLAYPLLEGVIRRKLSRLISSEGVVLIDPQLVRTNGKLYKQGSRMNNLDDELRLLERETHSAFLKRKLQYLREHSGHLEIHKWRCPLLHGELTASWHGLSLLLLTYAILLEE
jgi:hypothetical protein